MFQCSILIRHFFEYVCPDTHGQKPRRSQEKQIIITCRDIYVHQQRSQATERERERERGAKLETWSEFCDMEQQQVHYCAVFFPAFTFVSSSQKGGPTQLLTSKLLRVCVSVQSPLSKCRSLPQCMRLFLFLPRSLAR
jgi:hypothetical protein